MHTYSSIFKENFYTGVRIYSPISDETYYVEIFDDITKQDLSNIPSWATDKQVRGVLRLTDNKYYIWNANKLHEYVIPEAFPDNDMLVDFIRFDAELHENVLSILADFDPEDDKEEKLRLESKFKNALGNIKVKFLEDNRKIKKYTRYFESKIKKLVVCDVQLSSAKKYIKFNLKEFAKFVNTFDDVLVLYNGEDFGWETEGQMRQDYRRLGITNSSSETALNKTPISIEYFNKGYGFFREWMDNQVDDFDIIEVGKFMLMNSINDSREITNEEIRKSPILSRYFDEEIPIYFNRSLNNKLKEFEGAFICGGARNECLHEIMLLSDILDLKFKKVEKFIYG